MSEGIWVCREGFELFRGDEGGESEKMSERVWAGGVMGGVGGGEGAMGRRRFLVEVGVVVEQNGWRGTDLWGTPP